MQTFNFIWFTGRQQLFQEHRALCTGLVIDLCPVRAVIVRRKRLEADGAVLFDYHHAVAGMDNISAGLSEVRLSRLFRVDERLDVLASLAGSLGCQPGRIILPRVGEQLLRDKLQEFHIGNYFPEPCFRLVLAPENVIPNEPAFPYGVPCEEILVNNRGPPLSIRIKRLPEILDQIV